MRLVGYVRVSTEGQVDGHGLAIQRERIARWCEAVGAVLVAVHADEGVSGATDALDRAGLAEALSALQTGAADGLVIVSLDRLARRLDVQEAALATAWRSGARVFTVETGEVLADDPDDPMRSFVRKVLGLVSELEAQTITARLRRGRQAKRAAGGYAGGRPPYGTKAKAGKLVEEPAEAAVVAEVVALREAGVSLRGIAEHLNGRGVPTRHGGRWHPTTVRRIADPGVRAAEAAYDARRRLRDGTTRTTEAHATR